jgi:hypothetical protein
MKALTTALIGTGAGAIVLMAYLSLGQQEQTKKEIAVDKAQHELENARFDKDFDEKWGEFDGKKPSKQAIERHDQRIEKAEKEAEEAKKTVKGAAAQNAKDLADLKAAIEEADKQAANK